MAELTIESAKQFLKENGYYTDNLWSVEDVSNKYDCTFDQAQEVLNDTLTNEYLKGEINTMIDMNAGFLDLKKKKGKYFDVSGFWKSDKSEFSNRIIQEFEFDEDDEEEDERIFFYGLNEDAIKLNMNHPNGSLDFVITSYEPTTLD